tara:strand:- start:39 stop:347 length:309 start_codon:yes stop_codon:yes gene_type:complete
MIESFWTYFIIILTIFVCLFICLSGIIKLIYEDFVRFENERRRRNRIVPISTLIRIAQDRHNREARERYIIEVEQYNKVMSELKNKIIVINPDDSMSLGTEN